MLYPSPGLYPSALLFPGFNGEQAIALGIGPSGSFVDVSDYVTGPEGIQYTYGRQSEFRDPSPGQMTFILDNYDGRFTPGNLATPLATPLAEGTAVCWEFASRLVTGIVSAIGMASSEDQWGRVTITVGDVTYVANRTVIPVSLAAAMGQNAATWYWPMNEPVGSVAAAEYNGIGSALVPSAGTTYAFGASALNGETQLQVTSSGTPGQFTGTVAPNAPYIANATVTPPAWVGFWFTPDTSGHSQLVVDVVTPDHGDSFPSITCTAASVTVALGTGVGSATAAYPVSTGGQPYYVSVQVTGFPPVASVYINGTLVGQLTFTGGSILGGGPTNLNLTFGDGTANTSVQTISHLSFSNTQLLEASAAYPDTFAKRIQAIACAVPEITIGTVDAAVSSAILDPQTGSNVAAWSLICDMLRTEQGHLYASTSGSLLSPSTVVNVRSRTRPTTPKVSFDAQLEVNGVPQFVRDVTNMSWSVTASGPNRSAVATDRSIVKRVGSATTSETVVLRSGPDLQMWAQDRLIRGENVNLRVVSVTIDARVTPTSRFADLLGLVVGDRIRISNLPNAGLGFTTWDGWFLGASEVHNFQSDAFTLYMAPVLPPTAVFDTDRFASGGGLALNAAVTSAQTTIPVVTTDALLETVQVPYTLQIESEQLVVTACTAPAAGVQTATVTRGANGTTAAAHSLHTLVDLASPGIYAF